MQEYRNLDEGDFDDNTMEPLSCEVVFAEWTEEHLRIVADEKDIDTQFRKSELRDATWKDLAVDAVSDHVRRHGVKLLVQAFDLGTLKQLTRVLSEEFLTKNGNSATKTVLAKRLTEAIIEQGGFMQYLSQKAFGNKKQVANLFVGLLNFLGATSSSTSRTQLSAFLSEELDTFYLRAFLEGIPAHFLRSVCDEIKIFHGNCASSSVLAECIITGTWYEPKAIIREEPSREEKPKKISERLNKADLTHWFLASELKEFCEKHELVTSGKKTELAQRIMNYFDPEKENETKEAKKARGRKRKTSRIAEMIEEPMQETSSKKRRASIQRGRQAMDISFSDDSFDSSSM